MFQPNPGSARPRWRLALPFAALAALLCASEASAQRALLTHAAGPVKLIRKTRVYDARAGAGLYAGDVVGTDGDGAQFELPGGALVALGAGTTIVIDAAGAPASLTLLRGWVKVKAAAGPGTLGVAAGALAASPADSAILHAEGDATEAFAESGAVTIAAIDKPQQAAPFTLGRERYLAYRPGQTLQALPGAPPSFVAAMPRAYFDPLIALAARAQPTEPVARREVDAADIAAWNDAPAPVRERLAQRFAPRLADPAFRAAATTLLAKQPEWRPALRDAAAPPRKKPATLPNHLF